jgi:hypothetical protein
MVCLSCTLYICSPLSPVWALQDSSIGPDLLDHCMLYDASPMAVSCDRIASGVVTFIEILVRRGAGWTLGSAYHLPYLQSLCFGLTCFMMRFACIVGCCEC